MSFEQPAGHLLGKAVHLYETGGWAAVYADGDLVDGPGDIDNRYEYLLHGFNVYYSQDRVFLDCIDPATGKITEKCATTLDEITRRIEERGNRQQQATNMREQAAKLLADADILDPEGKYVPWSST